MIECLSSQNFNYRPSMDQFQAQVPGAEQGAGLARSVGTEPSDPCPHNSS